VSRLRIHRDGPAASAVADTALSHALLRAVDAGEAPESLRLYQPCDAMAFSVLDRTRPGFDLAVERARRAGFEPIVRLAGGRAAVFERHALAFAWTVPAREPRLGIRARFEALSTLIARALCSLGVDARVGEVEGEYCPGEYSVNARGAVKLMGVGQRVLRRAAHVGGVVIVRGAPRIAGVLEDVYAALDLPLDASRTGAVEDEVPGVTAEAVAEALLAEIGQQRSLAPCEVPDFVRAQAKRFEPLHAPAGAGSARALAGKTLTPGH
jgi:lipoate-protein ligase A